MWRRLLRKIFSLSDYVFAFSVLTIAAVYILRKWLEYQLIGPPKDPSVIDADFTEP